MARDPAPSILAALEARGQSAPRVRLNEVPDESSPTLAEVELRPGARFDVLGQIAQGGVGKVIKGRDVDLGRDVALKVLLEKHLDNTDLVRRFVEEAQIGGQLQHPGIVPVYELGLLPDRQPFFAMKLVKGKTMAALLTERGSPESDRRRLLSVFERVCRTMAYAHSRGVIHRDLKPSNVMVGAFGEVQILDWGFAKVLEQGGIADERRRNLEQADITRIATLRSEGVGSESIPGSVMGTPAYMPPEQALGHIDEMDERSDVFSLGAILTELLTGDPPYAGAESPMDCILMAIRGDVEAALERLEACEADPALTDLAKRCLSALRKDRPRDAGEMAAAVSDYLTEIDARAHRSRVAAEEARAKAEEEHARAARAREQAEAARIEALQLRKKGRQTLALAASIVLALLIGGGAFAWIEGNRHAQEQETARAVNAALKEAAHARGEGDLPKALALATKARDLAEAQEADEETRGRTEALLAELLAVRLAADQQTIRAREDAELIARLEFTGPEFSPYPDWKRVDTDYRHAFEEYGLDLDRCAPSVAAEWIRSRSRPQALAAHLDRWALRRHAQLKDLDWRRLQEAALLADPEPVRCSVRRALIAGRREDALRHIEDADPKSLAPESLVWMIELMTLLGRDDLVRELTREGVRLHPGSYDLRSFIAADLCIDDSRARTPQELREGVEHCTAAIALRPDEAWPWSLRGAALRRLRDLDGALADARRAVQLLPELPLLHSNLGNALRGQGDNAAAVKAYRKALELDGTLVSAHNGLANSLRELGKIERAFEAYRKGLEAAPDDPFLLYNLGSLYADERGDQEKALELFEKVGKQLPGWSPAHAMVGSALQALGRFEEAVAAFRHSLDLANEGPRICWFKLQPRPGGSADLKSATLHKLGSSLSSLGKLDDAMQSYRESLEADPRHQASRVNLAELLRMKGEVGEAERLMRTAVEEEPGYHGGHIALGTVLADTGRLKESASVSEVAAHRFPQQPLAWFNLGRARCLRGDWMGAVNPFISALELDPGLAAPIHIYLAQAYLWLNRIEEAIESASKACTLNPSVKLADYLLGHAYVMAGRFASAREPLTRALEAQLPGVRATARDMLSRCRRYMEIEERLPALLEQTADPVGAQECHDLATALLWLGRNREDCFRLFKKAIDLDPSLDDGDRQNPACAALLCGNREQALAWLRETLSMVRKRLRASVGEPARGQVSGRLRQLRYDPDLAAVRREDALAVLPGAEQEAWRAFWTEVDELIREAEK